MVEKIDLGTGILRNLTDGGEGSSGCKRKCHTPETRAKISKALSGRTSPNFGKTATPETRANMSRAQSGENHYNFGKKNTPETIAKRLATRARNKEAKALLAEELLQDQILVI